MLNVSTGGAVGANNVPSVTSVSYHGRLRVDMSVGVDVDVDFG